MAKEKEVKKKATVVEKKKVAKKVEKVFGQKILSETVVSVNGKDYREVTLSDGSKSLI